MLPVSSIILYNYTALKNDLPKMSWKCNTVISIEHLQHLSPSLRNCSKTWAVGPTTASPMQIQVLLSARCGCQLQLICSGFTEKSDRNFPKCAAFASLSRILSDFCGHAPQNGENVKLFTVPFPLRKCSKFDFLSEIDLVVSGISC